MSDVEALEKVATAVAWVADARDLLIEWQTKQINRLENQNQELLKMFQTLSITELGVIWARNPPPVKVTRDSVPAG